LRPEKGLSLHEKIGSLDTANFSGFLSCQQPATAADLTAQVLVKQVVVTHVYVANAAVTMRPSKACR
jgi:hypothetical protein